MDLFILSDGKPKRVDSVREWGEWFETSISERIVGHTWIADGVEVSTVFLGIDHAFNMDKGHRPVLYETMIFGGPCDLYTQRYGTREEALTGHDETVAALKAGTLECLAE